MLRFFREELGHTRIEYVIATVLGLATAGGLSVVLETTVEAVSDSLSGGDIAIEMVVADTTRRD